MDVESLKQSGDARRRRLDVCLVASVVFLFVAVAAVAAGGVMSLVEIKSTMDKYRQPPQYEKVRQLGTTPSPSFKMQNFANVRFSSSKLMENHTVTWTPIHHGESVSVGEQFDFDSKRHFLQPIKDGYYFIYIDLNLTCNFQCKAGRLTLSVSDALTCSVELPDSADSNPVSNKCWTVAWLKGEKRLITQMTVPENGLPSWTLDLNRSGLGIFLLD